MPSSPPYTNKSSLSLSLGSGAKWEGMCTLGWSRLSAGFQDGGCLRSVEVLVFGPTDRAVTQVVGLDNGW